MRHIMVGAASGILAAGFGVAAAENKAAAYPPQTRTLVPLGGAVNHPKTTANNEVAVS